MRPAILLAFLLTIFHSSGLAQPQSRQITAPGQRSRANQSNQLDQLGMTCAGILQMSSADWVAHFDGAAGEKNTPSPAESTIAPDVSSHAPAEKTLRAITSYGRCYDARTDRLVASLAKSGKGPLMGARGNFRDFDQALKSFTTKALAESQPPADTMKSAYAALYEKQFRYTFYQSYDVQAAKPSPADKGIVPAAPPAAKPAPVISPAATNAPAPATKEVDPFTLAKNHFGELLGDLPDDKMHDLHAAFGEVLVRNSVGANMQLSIYRYAIFLLEPPPVPTGSGHPFAAPPF
jgi:hypothetical protein